MNRLKLDSAPEVAPFSDFTPNTRLYPMRRTLTIIAVALLGACTQLPTASSPDRPTAPRFDGGFLGGSGNVVSPPPPDTQSTATSPSDVAADSTSRGGFLGGSGN